MNIIEELATKARTSVPDGLEVDVWVAEYNKIFAGLVVKEILSYASDGDLDYLIHMTEKNFGKECQR